MIGAILGAASSIASGVAGAIMGARKRRQQRNALKEQREIEDAWYNRNYNADYTQRADSQRMLTKTAEAFKNRNKAIEGMQAVTGANEDAVAAQREQNNQAVSDVASQIAASGEQYKNAIDQQHMQNQIGFKEKESEIAADESAQNAQAINGALAGVGKIATSLDSINAETKANNANLANKKMETLRGQLNKDIVQNSNNLDYQVKKQKDAFDVKRDNDVTRQLDEWNKRDMYGLYGNTTV